MDRDDRLAGQAKEKKKFSFLGAFLVLLVGGSVAIYFSPNFRRARGGGDLTNCKTNLKNIGAAMNSYSSDWSGRYPDDLSQLAPNYMKTIPECRGAGEVAYRALSGTGVAYNEEGFEEYYFIWCSGENHTVVGVPTGYPQYDGIQGLIER